MTYLILDRPPKRVWRGKHKLVRGYGKYLTWTLGLKVGDYVNTCVGYNQMATQIEWIWVNEGARQRGKPNKTLYLDKVKFGDAGGLHYAPTCTWPALTSEEVTSEFKEWFDEYSSPQELIDSMVGADADDIERNLALQNAISLGLPIVDEFGELLVEFRKYKYFDFS